MNTWKEIAVQFRSTESFKVILSSDHKHLLMFHIMWVESLLITNQSCWSKWTSLNYLFTLYFPLSLVHLDLSFCWIELNLFIFLFLHSFSPSCFLFVYIWIFNIQVVILKRKFQVVIKLCIVWIYFIRSQIKINF